MKAILSLVFILLMQNIFAQNQTTNPCDARLLTEFDSSREVYVRNVRESIVIKKDEKNKLTLGLLEMERTIILSISVMGAGDCIDENNKVTISFRDGTRFEMLNNGGFNCDAEFSVFFGGDFGHKKELNLLLSKEIETIRVDTRKSTIDKSKSNVVEVTVPEQTSKLIMESLSCLMN